MSKEAAFYVSVLASGSTGNSLYIETEQKKILVDAGLSGKKITSLMAEVDRLPQDLDAILVTHEHTDHIKGVGVLSRKYGIDVYANEPTWTAMAKNVGKIADEHRHIFSMGSVLTIGDMSVESFGVSHDAAAPQFYQFHKNNKSFAILTDTGYCNDRIRGTIKNADGYVIESNHDLEMLRMGSYPWSLKQRILGDTGHLSNEDGALVMTDLIGNKTKRVFLGHLSRENNIKELAHMTMKHILNQHDIDTVNDVHLYDTDPEVATELFAI